MTVVEFALKHKLCQKALVISTLVSVLALISIIIAVLESEHLESTVIFVSIFIYSIVARIYIKMIDPQTLELRDWGCNKRQPDCQQNIEDWRDETIMLLRRELDLSLEDALEYVNNSIDCRGEEVTRQAPIDFVKTAKRLGLSFCRNEKKTS